MQHNLWSRACSVDGSALVPGGAMRIKGVVHTDRGWRVVQADADGVRFTHTAWGSGSRVELIAPPALDGSGVEAALLRLIPSAGC